VLSVYLHQGSLTLPMALEIQRAAQLLMADREFVIDSEGVLRLAADSGCSAYDAEFVYLAQSEGIPLITSDRALLRKFPETTATPAAFAVGD
jgi:predicted nucleic acid-binding protein